MGKNDCSLTQLTSTAEELKAYIEENDVERNGGWIQAVVNHSLKGGIFHLL